MVLSLEEYVTGSVFDGHGGARGSLLFSII